ncbi:glycosyltransferase [Chlorogloeopsis sp. ULAP02]|uniref:glycosyltransferase n=1 Tax=Chlorogloeopsis sp. ULAP02 TaxID=3107926 RepID=UPI0031371979
MNKISQSMPIISVIIPTYNSEKTIKYTIESVLHQTFTNFEIIIINDGSQDSTLDIISQINDARIKVFSFDNAGANVSRNRGLKLACGEFVSFLDSDDLWTSNKLEQQLEALQQNYGAVVAYSWTDYINEKGEFLLSGTHIAVNGDVYEQLLVTNFFENGSNPLIKKYALIELGGFDECLEAGQDWDMWLRLAAKYHFVAVPSVQILYRISPNSLSSNLIRQEKVSLQVLEKSYKQRPATFQDTWNKSLANIYKYLLCKSLQPPLNRQKAFLGAKFLWKFFINDQYRFQRNSFNLRILMKIVMIILLPPNFIEAFLTSINNNR